MVRPNGIELKVLFLLLCLLVSPRSSHSLENIRVAYPSMSASVLFFIIAQKEGYFREEGLNVEMLNIRGEIAIRTALAGEVDFFTNAGSALAAAVRGIPVKILAVTQDRPSWDLIVSPEIKSISQLRGTTIGIMSPEGSLAVVTREILQRNGMDPAKDVNLVVMGGDDVRYPALKGKAIQATLMNTTTSLRAQKEGFPKLTTASDYVRFIQGGVVAPDDKLKQNPARTAKFIRGAMKGLHFLLGKKDPTIKYLMDTLRLKDRELAVAIYDAESKVLLRDAVTDDKILQSFIDDMKKTTKVTREIKVNDIFDLSFVRKANEELKAKGWKP